MKILKNDVTAILGEKVKSKSARNRQFSIFPPGPDKQISLCRANSIQQYFLRYQFVYVREH